jgi:hypothetical protein
MNMKTRQSRRQTAKVSHSRWLAYATAGAATALAGTNSAEAAIHYSGVVKEKFPPSSNKIKSFQLDQPGDSFRFGHVRDSWATFNVNVGGFRGFLLGTSFDYYVSKLSFGQSIAAGPFTSGGYYYGGFMARDGLPDGQWRDPGVGFVGFRFDRGAGIQYGWARVKMAGAGRSNGFVLLDYAYGDPGEPIRAGQGIPRTGEDGQDMSDEQGPDEGSLGGLALGAVGLLAWRKSRSRTARYTKSQLPV